MSSNSKGFGNLVKQPQYIPSNTYIARRAAPHYRWIIYILTMLIVLITFVKSVRYIVQPSLATGGLFFALLGYTAIFVWRVRMDKNTEYYFYKPYIQFIRGQASLMGVSFLIFLLAADGYYDNMLWLLYILATLLISEHNSTPWVLATLLEVAVLYILAAYVGWSLHLPNNWLNLGAFWSDNNNLFSHILGIWLVTFISHYLVRNIHGRDKTLQQQQDWLHLISEQSAMAETPAEQRASLVRYVEEFTGAQARLWVPQLKNSQFIDDKGQEAPESIVALARQGRPVILSQHPAPEHSTDNCWFLQEPPIASEAAAQIIIPVQQTESPHELIAILDIIYQNTQPKEYQLQMDCNNLLNLTNHTRLILINSFRNEQTQLKWRLSFQTHRLINTKEMARQVANDVVDHLGFDFATVSLVDDAEKLIRCVAGREADWVDVSIHPLSGNDVQSRVVCTGETIVNSGKYEPYLDGNIWNNHKHGRISRVWVPIPDPSENPPYPALGTIEAGFQHTHRKIIPSDLIQLLEQYARHMGLAFANAERHQRICEMAADLTSLQAISREMQQAAAFYEPYQMIRLIGESAEKLLAANIVMLYTFNESDHTLELPYKTEQAINGSGKLCISLKSGILHKLYADRYSYYSSDARQDPLLVNFKKDGRLSRKERTFTQRQNIKSVAGIPLVDKRDNILGFLCINYHSRREFYEEFRHLFELFAQQSSVALEETYNHRLSRRMAIAQERNNLASELHHALSQQLYGLKQYARTAFIYAQRQEMSKVIENLDKVKNSAVWSLEELQDMLNSLHERPNGHIDFIDELTDYIARMRAQHEKVDIRFIPNVAPDVPNQVQFYLLRIARESINNALRHGQCRTVTVRYCADESGATQLIIEDDGIGFNIDKARQNGRYGLGTMEYYARQINSDLRINSQDEKGTRIYVSVSPPPKGV